MPFRSTSSVSSSRRGSLIASGTELPTPAAKRPSAAPSAPNKSASEGWRAVGWVQREKIGLLDEGMRGEEERERNEWKEAREGRERITGGIMEDSRVSSASHVSFRRIVSCVLYNKTSSEDSGERAAFTVSGIQSLQGSNFRQIVDQWRRCSSSRYMHSRGCRTDVSPNAATHGREEQHEHGESNRNNLLPLSFSKSATSLHPPLIYLPLDTTTTTTTTTSPTTPQIQKTRQLN
ncbi:hypothetical protein EYF80_034227 [Liparis tanakae]|uniref:Uncharacterized protein n=1 Tax=Liparis tanakae TaxID=230148 RepID=A0A4Z2GQB5_9TELE|nr:hypothetical protein EYF80_034227 [Liparis tanakae]